jgi:hypothetical protein
MPLRRDIALEIRRRIEIFRQRFLCRAQPAIAERPGGCFALDRPHADAEKDEARQVAGLRTRREPDHGVIAAASRELDKGEARVGSSGGNLDGGEDFIGRKGGLVESPEERRRRDLTRAATARQMQHGVERDDTSGQLRGRIGMSEAAAESAAVANGGVSDVGDRLMDQWRQPGDGVRAADVALPRKRADAQTPVALFDDVEPRDAVDVDEQPGLEQAHVERRHQALAAGEDLCVGAMGLQRREYVVERTRLEIAQPRRLHDPSAGPASSAHSDMFLPLSRWHRRAANLPPAMRDFGSFDYVIVGGGSAGCVLANRLSASPSHRVLLLEAGGEDRNTWIHIPLGYGKLFTNARLNWLYESEPEPGLEGRRIVQLRGKVLGGSSSINGCIYIRGQKEDSIIGAPESLPPSRRRYDSERGQSLTRM